MKTIKLKQISLLNFKGIGSLTLDFSEQETTIAGANGTGKTTVFDAFTWLLFGKDSQDRKDFEIKTIGADGKAVPRLPHEVSAVLVVDGQSVSLRKTFNEKWTKRRGSSEEVFDGHEVGCFYNDVPLRVGEYNERIAEICPEQTFKLITNPLCFTSQKPDVQRQMLFHLAGEVSERDIVAAHPAMDFAGVLDLLSGKSTDDLKKEIAAKKKHIKDAVESIPARIDERKRSEETPKDRGEIERKIAASKKRIEQANAAISERTKAYDIATAGRHETAKKISQKQVEIMQRQGVLNNELTAEYYQAEQRHRDAVSKHASLVSRKRSLDEDIKRRQMHLSNAQKQREEALKAYYAIQEETLEIDESKFVCPTCKRALEAGDIERKKSEMLANFNTDKARRLASNKQQGLQIKEDIAAIDREIKDLQTKAYETEVEMKALEVSQEYITEPQMPDNIEEKIASDSRIQSLEKEVCALQAELGKEVSVPNCEDLLASRREHEDALREAEIELAEQKRIEENLQRIAELEEALRAGQEELAALERTEYNVNAYCKARTQAIEERVNGMFRMVKFKLFDTLVNGSEVDTCEATVDGVPFGTINQAMRLNAGLDTINTLNEREEICAPIIIDNRESVTEIAAPQFAQIINLKVMPDASSLRII